MNWTNLRDHTLLKGQLLLTSLKKYNLCQGIQSHRVEYLSPWRTTLKNVPNQRRKSSEKKKIYFLNIHNYIISEVCIKTGNSLQKYEWPDMGSTVSTGDDRWSVEDTSCDETGVGDDPSFERLLTQEGEEEKDPTD